MRKLKLYIATSLDGKIAGPKGEVDWLEQLPNPEHTDYGYQDFLSSTDTTIMGHETYREVLKLSHIFPYQEKINYVFTRNQSLRQDDNVHFISEDPTGFVQKLKREAGKDIWLIGGGHINTLLQRKQLVDEYLVFVMPIILGEGIPLFADHPGRQVLVLTSAETYSSGVVCLRYQNRKS